MATVTMETKQSKILELSNLISQYDNGERENINASEYPQWQAISEILKHANIEENIYDDFLKNPSHYKVIDNEITYNENWQAEAEQKEAERIGNLHITKQDFYIHLCKPIGITYKMLTDKITELNMQAEWELCNHVYYGIIKPFLNALPLEKTDAEIIEVFEQYCSK